MSMGVSVVRIRRNTARYSMNLSTPFNKDEMPQFAPVSNNVRGLKTQVLTQGLDRVNNEQRKLNESLMRRQ